MHNAGSARRRPRLMQHTRQVAGALAVLAVAGACSIDNPTAPASSADASKNLFFDNTPPVAVSAYALSNRPVDVLATVNGVPVLNGGYGSALDHSPFAIGEFYSLTDRGPNTSDGNNKIFPVPAFHPQVGRYHIGLGGLVKDAVIVLKDASGNPLTGLPVGPSGCGATGEVPEDINKQPLAYDPNGIDSEGLRMMPDGSFWVSDEYGPYLVHFDRNGRTIERDSPCGGPHPLPAVLAHRVPNKGMEGLASVLFGRFLVGVMQNALDNHADKNTRLLRIVYFDTWTGKSKQFAYLMDDKKYGVSEIEAVTPTRFLVDERDGKFFNDPSGPAVQKKVWLIDITGATDLSDPANGPDGLMINGKTIEGMTDADLAANKIVPVTKVAVVVDLLQFGYPHDKAEGMALIDNGRTIAISNDADFGVTDDGSGNLIQKLLPSGQVDFNEVWFFRLSKSLYDLR